MHERNRSYERQVRPEATLDDLDLELAAAFLAKTSAGEHGPATPALHGYGLIEPEGKGWGITNAALLLFAREPADRWHPRAGIRAFRVTGTRRVPGRAGNVNRAGRAGLPLARAIEEIRPIIRGHIRRSDPLRHIFFRDLPEYPDAAWREALVNAVAHRDYEIRDRETEVWFFDDRLEVASPGELLEPLELDALQAGDPVQAARNPLIARVLADTGYMRADGSGLGRMRASMKASFLKEPGFAENGVVFSVTLHKEPTYETAGAGWPYLVRQLGVSADQRRILLARPDGFSHVDYQLLNTVHENEAKMRVQELVEEGILFRDFDTADEVTMCYLTAELDAARWFLEARVPRLREHFRKDPWLRSSDYRTLFKVSPRDAAQEVAQLVKLGFLRAEGRGRAARYMPTAGLRG